MAEPGFVDVLCDFKRQVTLLFMISLLSIGVLLVSLTYVRRGTGTYVIAMVQLVSFAVLFVLSGALMVTCGRRGK